MTSLQIRVDAEKERRRRLAASGGLEVKSKYQLFREKYICDPAGFVNDCITWKEGEHPTAYQNEILSSILSERRISVRSPHGTGKSALSSWVILWFSLVHDEDTDWKVPITASAWRQLNKMLMPEVHKWSRRLKWGLIGRVPFNERTELLDLSLKLKTGEAFAMASDKSERMEGSHGESLLFVFDESKEIPAATWDSAEGAFSTGSCYFLSVSTPGEPAGRFYEIQAHRPGFDDWHVRHITLKEAIDAGRINPEWARQRAIQWGEESAVYKNRVLGEFASSEEDGVIPLSWIEAANARWLEWNDKPDTEKAETLFKCVGVDVARSGEDKTVLAPRYGDIITELRPYVKRDTMSTTGMVEGILNAHGGYAVVDVIGVGAGVVDRLRELKKDVKAFNASEHTNMKDVTGELGFINVRSASWWLMRELLDPAQGHEIALPPEDMLTGDLTAPHWKVLSGGKIQVESKEDVKARIGRSTDFADAVIMAFWEDREPSMKQWIAAYSKQTKKTEV